jgi:ribosomal protein L24E
LDLNFHGKMHIKTVGKRMAPKNIPCAASTANRRKPQKIVWQAAKKIVKKKKYSKNPQSGRNTGSI